MRIGAVVLNIFATIWWIVGAVTLNWSPALSIGVPVVILLYLFLIQKKSGTMLVNQSEQESRRIGRLVSIASSIEGIAIFITVNILANLGKSELLLPIIAIIVGLHFLPLARWIPSTVYYYTAVVLILLGTIGLCNVDSILRMIIVCFGSALTLWLTSYSLIRRLTSSSRPKV